MANKIKSLVVRQNNYDYPAGKLQSVPCENTKVIGTFWRTPRTGSGVWDGTYTYHSAENGAAKPTADSLKVLQVKNDITGDDTFIALTDDGSIDQFNSRCNQCCDDVQDMPAVTIPDPIVEETACPDEDDNRNFFTITRALVSGEVYDFYATLDGEALDETQPEGFASLAAFKTWANTNWAPASVDYTGTKVTLTSATATTGSIQTNIKKYFESNAPGSLTSGQAYTLNATLDGTALTPIVGAADAVLSTIADAANADVTYRSYGRWSVVGGKIRLVSATVTTADVLNVTKA